MLECSLSRKCRQLNAIPSSTSSFDNRNDIICNYLYYKPFYGMSSGTGFAISNDGYVVTNHHVIDGAKNVGIKGVNGDFNEALEAKVIKVDAKMILLSKITDKRFNGTDIPPFNISPSVSDVGTSIRFRISIKINNGR